MQYKTVLSLGMQDNACFVVSLHYSCTSQKGTKIFKEQLGESFIPHVPNWHFMR
jgi:hypothetical protein